MFKIIAFVGVICALFVSDGDTAPTDLQVLPEREGYIPVYIRNGNTPLVEINPGLAEAFHEMNNIQARESKTDENKKVVPLTTSTHEEEINMNKRQTPEDLTTDASKSSSQNDSSNSEEHDHKSKHSNAN